jgi:hypothetical protein
MTKPTFITNDNPGKTCSLVNRQLNFYERHARLQHLPDEERRVKMQGWSEAERKAYYDRSRFRNDTAYSNHRPKAWNGKVDDNTCMLMHDKLPGGAGLVLETLPKDIISMLHQELDSARFLKTFELIKAPVPPDSTWKKLHTRGEPEHSIRYPDLSGPPDGRFSYFANLSWSAKKGQNNWFSYGTAFDDDKYAVQSTDLFSNRGRMALCSLETVLNKHLQHFHTLLPDGTEINVLDHGLYFPEPTYYVAKKDPWLDENVEEYRTENRTKARAQQKKRTKGKLPISSYNTEERNDDTENTEDADNEAKRPSNRTSTSSKGKMVYLCNGMGQTCKKLANQRCECPLGYMCQACCKHQRMTTAYKCTTHSDPSKRKIDAEDDDDSSESDETIAMPWDDPKETEGAVESKIGKKFVPVNENRLVVDRMQLFGNIVRSGSRPYHKELKVWDYRLFRRAKKYAGKVVSSSGKTRLQETPHELGYTVIFGLNQEGAAVRALVPNDTTLDRYTLVYLRIPFGSALLL